ncbi:MAG: sulfotransferase family protein [Nocardioides sp.]
MSTPTKSLILITGTGRSGTSTMSGLLHYLGLSVPGPYLGANESNPKGFFESRWAVKFHKRIAARAGINDFDGRPNALQRMRDAITDDDRRALATFLARFERDAHVVVKDPRSVWTQELWRAAATEAGRETRYLSMLRHPAEVAGSRLTYYANQTDERKRIHYETFTVTRWVNGSLINERETRGQQRAFIQYLDLLGDWRQVVRKLNDQWDLAVDLDGPGARAVDEFIDPGLRRHATTWAELGVPASLREIAQPVWDSLVSLSAAGGEDPDVSAALDHASVSFERLFREAAAMSHDATEEVRVDSYAAGVSVGKKEVFRSNEYATQSITQRTIKELVTEIVSRAVRRVRSRRTLSRSTDN